MSAWFKKLFISTHPYQRHLNPRWIESLSQKIMFKAVYGLDISTNKDSIPESARELIESAESFMMPGRDGLKCSPLHHLFPSLKAFHLRVQPHVKQTIEGPWSLMMNALVSFFNESQ